MYFLEVDEVSKVLPILEKRLPKSCFIYNAAKMSSRFPEETSIFVSDEEVDESSWIIVTHFTENYGTTILISADEERSKFSRLEITKILSESNVIKWKESYWFVALEKWISEIIYEISLVIKGTAITVHPDVLFYKEPKDCLEMDTRIEDQCSNVEVKRLDDTLGVDFILNTWRYSTTGTKEVVQRIIAKNESGGVYVDNKPICGVTTHGYGLLSMLFTDKDHRNKGYAKICVEYVFKEQVKNGYIPSSTVDVSNTASISFHKKLGCKTVCRVYWMYFKATEDQ